MGGQCRTHRGTCRRALINRGFITKFTKNTKTTKNFYQSFSIRYIISKSNFVSFVFFVNFVMTLFRSPHDASLHRGLRRFSKNL